MCLPKYGCDGDGWPACSPLTPTTTARCRRSVRQGHARETGALALLPVARGITRWRPAHFPAARMTDAEALAVNETPRPEETRSSRPPSLARPSPAPKPSSTALVDRSHEIAASLTGRARASSMGGAPSFEIGLGRYEEALAAARKARAGPIDTGAAVWVLPELVEAAIRCAATRHRYYEGAQDSWPTSRA